MAWLHNYDEIVVDQKLQHFLRIVAVEAKHDQNTVAVMMSNVRSKMESWRLLENKTRHLSQAKQPIV